MRVSLPLQNTYLRFSSNSQNTQKTSVEKILESIPKDDCDILEKFFRNLVIVESAGYVLLGTKPIAWEDRPISKDTIATFKKYQHLFNCPNVVVRENPLGNSESIQVIIVNKKACAKAIKANLEEFQAIFGKDVNPEALAEDLATGSNAWTKLHQHEYPKAHTAYGILLGFGPENSRVYQRYLELSGKHTISTDELNRKMIYWTAKPDAKPAAGYKTAQDEMEAIMHSWGRKNPDDFAEGRFDSARRLSSEGPVWLPPYVGVLGTEETKQLEAQYKADQRKLNQMVSQPDFLKNVLQLLTS